ncbi:MAG: hypothetical protein WA874_09930 [Chryseosolibacter sp.]
MMVAISSFHRVRTWRVAVAVFMLLILFVLPSCDQDDPAPVNEEEVITTLEVTLTPDVGGQQVIMKFSDEDGEQGSIAPVITVSGSLKASTGYRGAVRFLNETVSPAEDISEEVKEEGNDHLVCFDSSLNIAIQYADTDGNGLPLGLATSWLTGAAGPAEVTISLRHQAGTKTGNCPGVGETDVEVTFNLTVE